MLLKKPDDDHSINTVISRVTASTVGDYRQEQPDDEDAESAKLLSIFHPPVLRESLPQSIIGDGNCLYHSVSLAPEKNICMSDC